MMMSAARAPPSPNSLEIVSGHVPDHLREAPSWRTLPLHLSMILPLLDGRPAHRHQRAARRRGVERLADFPCR